MNFKFLNLDLCAPGSLSHEVSDLLLLPIITDPHQLALLLTTLFHLPFYQTKMNYSPLLIPHEVSLLFLSPFCYSIPLDLSPHNSSLYFYILLFSQGPVQKLPPMYTLPCFSTIITYALKKLFTEIKASSAPIQWLPLQKDNLPKVTTALLFLF